MDMIISFKHNKCILTTKAPITIAADDKCVAIFPMILEKNKV